MGHRKVLKALHDYEVSSLMAAHYHVPDHVKRKLASKTFLYEAINARFQVNNLDNINYEAILL